ncbi:AMP-binding protein [Nocardia sp. BSTN01]|uniref:AMP-binding protein n=1 Tax=Nocardia sp. BSTN01 TaxID=2783665 RepID=UPI002815A6ED|nr:AMP-binding protein [Nocardia sp. BSTN01]
MSAQAAQRYGGLGGMPTAWASVRPTAVAVIDDRRSLTFGQFAERSYRLANAFRHEFPGATATVGIMCRNHADALVTMFGAAATGARVVLLNTDFGPAQVSAVCARERIDALVYDDEFADTTTGFEGKRWQSWTASSPHDSELDRLIAAHPAAPPPPAPKAASLVILTSGSSGVPKGAPRSETRSLLLPAGLLSRIPLRGNDKVLVAAPVFHGWGLLVSTLVLSLGSTLILQRRFEATRALQRLGDDRCGAFIAVPTMVRRMLDLGDAALSGVDLSALRIVASGGARLEPTLVTAAARTFGPVLYNLYGSTEASFISIATPADLADAPTSAGKPPLGVTVRITDEAGRAVPAGSEGRIRVRTPGQIEAYTDGRRGNSDDGYFDTGDRGRIDDAGRLHVLGRSDNMIVSGGENVYPEEVELALHAHDGIADAAVVGVDDTEFGQRLRAYIVPVAGTQLEAGDIRTHLAALLPRSRMPRDIVIVAELHRTDSGKVSRHTIDELKELHR